MFWVDLSQAGLIEGGFSTATSTTIPDVSGSGINSYFPQAKIGNGNYVYVWSGGTAGEWMGSGSGNATNYFGISAGITLVGGYVTSSPGLTVQQAYSIDKKVDDGFPQTGTVTATYVNTSVSDPYYGSWAGAASASNGPTTAATSGSASTCYDNGSTAGAQQQYSLNQNNGNGVNCALSFQFQ